MEENGVKDGGLELGLELSLGGSGTTGMKAKAAAAAAANNNNNNNGRILTAKDFPNGFSSSLLNSAQPNCNWSSGTKRERASSPPTNNNNASPGSASAASQVVGWPPVRAYRMNILFNQTSKTSNAEDGKGVGGNENNDSSNKKINHGTDKNDAAVKERGNLGFVKVKMDGLPIGRKVDLSAHKSYETLAKMLVEMFFKQSPVTCGGKEQDVQFPKLLDGSSDFVLTYEDKEGDWMLVGDVPWGMFLNTVKRLRIMKTSEANGLGPKFQERNEKQQCRPI